jgi:hypothetical protein
MFDTFTDVHAFFDEAESPEKRTFETRGLESCTLADLVKDQKSCHFCAMVISELRDVHNLPPYCSVTLAIEEDRGRPNTLLMKLWVNDNERDYGGVSIKSLECKWYSTVQLHPDNIAHLSSGRSNNIFDAPFAAHHIPCQPVDNLIHIQRWLDACTSKHVKCKNWCSRLETRGHQPTRVLELSDIGIRLRCDVQAIDDIKYLALSHMWGKDASKQLRLVSSKIQDFQKDIPLDMLPNIFTEAIRITRYLGFRYLWIDSLCIIQDSKSDWTAEANMMSAIYNNAVCTIAFVMPPDVSFDSTQRRGDPRVSTPCIIREPSPARLGIIARPFGADITPQSVYEHWPLCSRAWTFQEQVLSPRTVFWGDRTIKWECVEKFCDELHGHVEDHCYRGYSNFLSNKTLLSAQHIDIHGPNDASSRRSHNEKHAIPGGTLDIWLALIGRYRSRDLTQTSDRIMAFVGIAQAFQAMHGLTYLAGMWKEHLPASLLWYIDDPANSIKTSSLILQDPILESAPTWSFFASSIYSNSLSRDRLLQRDWSSPHLYSVLFSATLLHFTWPNAPVDSSPPTAYYNFAGLQITLKFITIDVPLPKDRERRAGTARYSVRCKSLEARLGSLFRASENSVPVSVAVSVGFYFDDYGNFDKISTEVRIALINEGCRHDGLYGFKGLVLGPGMEQDTWKRLGFCEGRAWYRDPHHSLWDMMIAGIALPESSTSKSGEESIFLRLEGARIETLTLV